MLSRASLIIDRVLSPRKSILIRPVDSITEPSYWVTSILSPVVLSSAVLSGTTSLISIFPMMIPQACTPVLRMFPSRIRAYFSVSLTKRSELSEACLSSGTCSMAASMETFLTLGILSGMSLASRSLSARGSFWTRATSLMALLAAIVP